MRPERVPPLGLFPGGGRSAYRARCREVGVLVVLSLCLGSGGAVARGQRSTAGVGDTIPDTSQASPPGGAYFYHGLPYGSQANSGPLDVLMNRGLAITQLDRTAGRKIFDYPYGVGHVSHSLKHPLAAIERSGGWWRFIRQEMLPLTFDPGDVKWYPNYTGHIIEGGIHTRRLAEWYRARGVPLAGLLSGVTNMAAALLNEMYEHPGGEVGNAATVADLYFFDLAGIVLFSFDGVARLFAEDLHANVWTGQASIVFPSGEVQNNAGYLYFKFPWGVVPESSIFFWTGMGSQIGLTFHRSEGLDLSVGVGLDAHTMQTDPETGEETADLTTYTFGLFLDRNESLLASVHLSQVRHRIVKLNVFPGVLRFAGGDFGAWLVLTSDLEVRFGISNRFMLGAGLGFGR